MIVGGPVALPALQVRRIGHFRPSGLHVWVESGVLAAEEGWTRRGIMCSHRVAVYTEQCPRRCGPAGGCACPEVRHGPVADSERAQEQFIVLPLFHEMTKSDLDQTARALRLALHGADYVARSVFAAARGTLAAAERTK